MTMVDNEKTKTSDGTKPEVVAEKAAEAAASVPDKYFCSVG
jgi:hypothetical protein